MALAGVSCSDVGAGAGGKEKVVVVAARQL